ncbi:LOW QUALITY PROTEIN: probable tubulin polyglutamylase TTLL2 [Pristis pectinata]|uniref:LOW QUALITY PROTEIN: probable tubulin polyglutamylase TTLL2 n=1 Tax=Pristis pectinata TaxID=685728 RepID=UPI00223E5D1D|nr:LOW QUALITY PROTEIN: probable tubulin polyglutamylase TTLL2 [Pristis pectinata]
MDSQKPDMENKSPRSSKLYRSTEECIKNVHGPHRWSTCTSFRTKESRKNCKLTRPLPKKTLTSQLRENLNKSSPIHTRNAINRVTLLEAHNAQSDQYFRKLGSRFPSVKLHKYDLASFPQYSISDYDKKPITRIGDFILTFPFNEVTLKASQDPLNIKVIMQELQKMLKRQVFRESKNTKGKTEAPS